MIAAVLAALLLAGWTSGDPWRSGLRGPLEYEGAAQTRATTTARALVKDAIPMWAVRYDDGRAGTLPQLLNIIAERVPLTLSINFKNIGKNGWLSADDLLLLHAHATRVGVPLEIDMHADESLLDPYEFTYDELVDELDPSEMIAALGEWARPRVYVQPGEDWPFMRRNRDLMRAVLDSLGFSFAQMGGAANVDSTGIPRAYPDIVSMSVRTETNTPRLSFVGAVRPGMLRDPFWIPEGVTIDLGEMVVERSGREWGNSLRPISSWLLKDKSGVGGDPAADQSRTWAHYYSVALSQNLGLVVAMHDSADTDLIVPNGLTGLSPGHFSPAHVAKTLRKLADAGHLRLGTLSEWCEWATSDYAPGTDLIANPSMLIPQFDIGDTSGVEYPWVRGLSSIGATGAAWGSVTWPFPDMSKGTDAKFNRDAARNPFDDIGESVTGYRGRPGGVTMVNGSVLNVGMGGLQPGRYRFSVATNSGADLQINDLTLSFQAAWFNTEGSWEAGGSSAYGDTVSTVVYQTTNVVITENEGAGTWHQLPVEFAVPAEVPGGMFGLGYATTSLGGARQTLTSRLWIGEPSWMFTIGIQALGDVTLSYPQFIYMGRR